MANIPFSLNNHFHPGLSFKSIFAISSGQNLFEPDAISKYLSTNDVINNFDKSKVSQYCYECFIRMLNSI